MAVCSLWCSDQHSSIYPRHSGCPIALSLLQAKQNSPLVRVSGLTNILIQATLEQLSHLGLFYKFI